MRNVTLLLFAVVLVLAVTQVGTAQSSAIKMNEIQSRGVAGDLDWIELYNSSSVAVNIIYCNALSSSQNGVLQQHL